MRKCANVLSLNMWQSYFIHQIASDLLTVCIMSSARRFYFSVWCNMVRNASKVIRHGCWYYSVVYTVCNVYCAVLYCIWKPIGYRVVCTCGPLLIRTLREIERYMNRETTLSPPDHALSCLSAIRGCTIGCTSFTRCKVLPLILCVESF
jgi:hypothetical protein